MGKTERKEKGSCILKHCCLLFNKHAFPVKKSVNLFCCAVPVGVGLLLLRGAWQRGCLAHQMYSINSVIC